MATLSESINALAAEFAKMPGIGIRTAERLAYHVQSISKDDAAHLVNAIRAVRAKALTCSTCFNVSETNPCPICRDEGRDRTTLCVVESVRDLSAIESSGGYRGLYHVLGGRIAPLEDVYPDQLNVGPLIQRVKEGRIREVILATNPDTEGDSTANFLMDKLAPLGVDVSVLARGVPAGGRLEHAAKGTLTGALLARRHVTAERKG